MKSASISRKYDTHINHSYFQTQHGNSLWKYVNKLFACKSAKPQWLQRNSLHLSQQPIRATDRIISLPGLLTTVAFAWERADTTAYSGKGFLGLSGVGYQRRGSCWQLTSIACFLKPGWSFSHCLLAAEIAGSGSLLIWSHARQTWNCAKGEKTLRFACRNQMA